MTTTSTIAPIRNGIDTAQVYGTLDVLKAQPAAARFEFRVRNSWIVEPNGGVTGVQQREDGSTEPAPTLTTDGIANIDGIEVRAIRVEGDSDV